MNHQMTRRQLLQRAAAGTASIAMTQNLSGCAHQGGNATTSPSAPSNPFLDWFGIDESRLSRVLAELTARGADQADLYFEHSRSQSIVLQDGIISRAGSGIDMGVGLRVVVGDQVGYAFTEDLSLESMLGAAQTAAAIARSGAAAAPESFTLEGRHDFYPIQRPWADVSIEEKLPLLRRAEELARASDPDIEKVTISWADASKKVLIATLDGKVYTDDRPMTRLWVSCTASRGDETQSQSANIAGRHTFDWYTEERIQEVVQQAVDRTMILFEAVRPPAGEMPVVLAAGASGILLHEAIGHGMEADFNRKGTSIYSEMLGQRVAPDFVTIVDDGTIPGERGALNLDDEGSPCERTVLVENGIMASYLHDRISARHYGMPASTGSGRRESFRHAPLPRMRCTFMEDGPHTRDEIIASVDRGIIAETYTNGVVQIGAGDFTFYIKNGWLIEGGRVTAPIKDVNIIGNGPEALRNITMVANDGHLDTGGWTCGKDGQGVPVSQGMPTALVSQLTVGGVDA